MDNANQSSTDVVAAAWEKHSGPAILTTVSQDGIPNAIYITCIKAYGPRRFVVADNYFCKTRANLAAGRKGSLLFITGDGKSFQLKGTLSVHGQGEPFVFMKSWLDPKYPAVAAVVLDVEEAYSGSVKLI